MLLRTFLVLLALQSGIQSIYPQTASDETFAALEDGHAPASFQEMWAGFDPQAEPLEVETLKEWEKDGVVLRVVRFRVGVFKGKPARLAAVYGFPKGQRNLPGLLQIHGGGQYADEQACLANAKRGYATVSIAWAGRIAASQYRVSPEIVKLFWDGMTDDPDYRLTTDWGAVDGYHAPGRNKGNQFPSVKPAAWTLDSIDSPRNSGWFLCAVAARRALTFLERQPEVDKTRLGVYGHSMGGKLTVLTAPDPRVKAAVPSCGGISDRYNSSALFRSTLGDDVSLREVTCPIFFLSPANDFHGRIGDLPKAVDEIKSSQWRVSCSSHHSHQDTPAFEVATLLWFDEHLKGNFEIPATPQSILKLDRDGGVPQFTTIVDGSMPIHSVDVLYTQHGKFDETPFDRENTTHRFWRHAQPRRDRDAWVAELPISRIDRPLWVYANVLYELDYPVSGAGYYYRNYTATAFNLSSLLVVASPEQLRAAGARPTLEKNLVIETFQGDWEKEWFTYKIDDWGRTTHKLYDDQYKSPPDAELVLEVQAEKSNQLVILIDDFAAEIALRGGVEPQKIVLSPGEFQNYAGEALSDWNDGKRLTLTAATHLKPSRGEQGEPRIVGKVWKGKPPRFHRLHWRILPSPASDEPLP